jgi:F-type H+-transporting ATPase subunit epsilon
MDGKLNLRILLPTREAVSKQVDAVNLTAAEGEVGILPGHAALLAALVPGPATIRDGASVEHWAIGPGFMEVKDDVVTVFARTAESAEEIDLERARRRLAERQEQLRTQMSEVEISKAELSLKKQLVRLQVGERR